MDLEGFHLQAAAHEPVSLCMMGGRIVVLARDHPVGVAATGTAAHAWKKGSGAYGVETVLWLSSPDLYDLPTPADTAKPGALNTPEKEEQVPAEGCKEVRQKHSHKKKDLAKLSLAHAGPITTLMIRNIPCSVTQRQMADVVAELGYGSKFDLLFMPTANRPSATGNSNLGYGFVNFTRAADAESFAEAIEGYKFQGTASVKVCTATPAHVQGFDSTLDQMIGLKKRTNGTCICSL